MILRRTSAQSRFASAYSSTTAFHATPINPDPTTNAFDASLPSNPASTTFNDISLVPDPVSTTSQSALISDPIRASLLTNRPDNAFAQKVYDYTKRSMEILQTQTETLVHSQQKLTSMNEDKESLEDAETEGEMTRRAAEYQCPLCSDLAWSPYVPQFSHTIQKGVEEVANYFQRAAPSSPHPLEWSY
ncbi:hypothetical protein GG344DRAFT_69355 [Lentinula edodes]|nr:hypothetical protein GG344DRAFT_69355 [Lentinula edodes]